MSSVKPIFCACTNKVQSWKRLQAGILGVALKAAEDSAQERCTAESIGVGLEQSMFWHRVDLDPSCANCRSRSPIGWIKYPNRVHQLLKGDGRVIDVTCSDELQHQVGCTALHAMNVDARVEEQARTGDLIFACERKLASVRLLNCRPRSSRPQERILLKSNSANF